MTIQTLEEHYTGPDFDEFEEAILNDFLEEWREAPQKISSLCPELITQCRIHLIHLEAWFRHVPHESVAILATLPNSTTKMVDQWKSAIAIYPRYRDVEIVQLGHPHSLEILSKRLLIADAKTVVVINFDDFPKIKHALITRGLLPKIEPWTSYIAFDDLLTSDKAYPMFVSAAETEIIFLQILVTALAIVLIGNRALEN